MSIAEALRKLIVDAATTAGARVYPLALPPDPTLPAVSYTRISTPRTRSLTGFSHLAWPRFQFTAWAVTYAAAKVLVDEIIVALDDYSGTVDGVVIQSSHIENEMSMYEPITGFYGMPLDFVIAHTE